MTQQELYTILKDEFNNHVEQNAKLIAVLSAIQAMELGFDLCFKVMIRIIKENNKNLNK